MAGCCDPSGYPGVFNRRTAERSVRSFRSRGLDSTARRMVEALTDRLPGATVVEVGAGAGTALAEMVEAGAERAVGIDISPNYEEVAEALLTERGVVDRVEWHTGDFVALAPDLPAGDIVFLNRVVCCYPDVDALLDAATVGPDAVALSFPRPRFLVRVFLRLTNVWMRMNRNSFRVFAHDPDRITDRLRAAGFEVADSGRTITWHWAVWTRAKTA